MWKPRTLLLILIKLAWAFDGFAATAHVHRGGRNAGLIFLAGLSRLALIERRKASAGQPRRADQV